MAVTLFVIDINFSGIVKDRKWGVKTQNWLKREKC